MFINLQLLFSLTPKSDIVEQLGLSIVPYIVLLMVPVLGRMADQDPSVRLMATHCFAALIRLMPLEVSIAENSCLSVIRN